MERNPPAAKLVRDGHGGRMEMGFDAFVKAREDCQDLDSRLYGRYQFKHDCRTYREFQDRNAMSPEQLKSLLPMNRPCRPRKCLPPQP